MKRSRLFSLFGLLAASAGGLAALPAAKADAAEREPGSRATAEHHARPRLIAERDALVPGSTAFLGITFDIDPGWHLYWDGASDTGMPIQVATEFPEGYTAGDLLWPAPKRHILPGDLLDYIYENRVTLILPVRVPRDAKPGDSVRFAAKLDWLECSDVCLPGEAKVEITLPVTDAPAAKRTADAPRFDEARARLPVPLPEVTHDVRLDWSGPTLTIVARAAKSVAFYPHAGCAPLIDPIRDAAGEGTSITLRFEPPASDAPDARRISGVLEVAFHGDRPPKFYRIDSSIP